MTGLSTLLRRLLRNTARSPFVVFSLIQPFLWLFLFGNLFAQVGRLPALAGQSYIGFLTPGIVIMSASVSSSFSGIATLTDLDRGLLERLFFSPISLLAVAIAPILQTAMVTTIPAVAIILVTRAIGIAGAGGAFGALGLLGSAFCIGLTFSGLSNAIGLVTRQAPAVIGIMNMLSLPLTFTSTMLISRAAMPAWIQWVATINPVDWAVSTARACYEGGPFGTDFAWRASAMMVMALVAPLLAVAAMRRYRRSL